MKVSKKVICSVGVGEHTELLAISRSIHSAYAMRHGYDLDLRSQLLDADRPPAWSKIRLIRELVERYDLVFWLDADAIIVDLSVDIATALSRDKLIAFAVHDYLAPKFPNTGVLVIRSDPKVAEFLDEVWDQTHFINHPWWEQAAMVALLGWRLSGTSRPEFNRPGQFQKYVAHLDERWNNIVQASLPRPRIRHYPGRSHRERLRWMARDANLLHWWQPLRMAYYGGQRIIWPLWDRRTTR